MLETLFLILCSQCSVCLETYTINSDEPLCITWVVVKCFSTSFNIHRGKISIVQCLWTGSSLNCDITLVEFNSYNSFYIPLTEVNRIPNQVHLWGEPEPIVTKAS